MCLFSFNTGDLEAAAIAVRNKLAAKKGRDGITWRTKTAAELVKLLPLSTWARLVRRTYLPPDEQLHNIGRWWQTYILTEAAFVARVDGKVKTLVRGGQEGMDKFARVMANQLSLVEKGMLSGACGVVPATYSTALSTLWACSLD